jgi:heme-degrading monooxygenase HmoA
MFIHSVLFEIEPKEISKYRKDSRMWGKYAKKAPGFISFYTMQLVNSKNQYASVYQWKAQKDYDRFMNKFHDWLASKSKSRVKLIGRYNLKAVDKIT